MLRGEEGAEVQAVVQLCECCMGGCFAGKQPNTYLLAPPPQEVAADRAALADKKANDFRALRCATVAAHWPRLLAAHEARRGAAAEKARKAAQRKCALQTPPCVPSLAVMLAPASLMQLWLTKSSAGGSFA
jgi:hypothetical protein